MQQWHTDGKSRYTVILASRDLRKSPTRSEALLWQALRGKSLGVRVRRQHAIGYFIVDFYIPKAKIAIELDGSSHQGRSAADQQRQSALESLGIRFLRFSADEVETGRAEVVRRIRIALETGRC